MFAVAVIVVTSGIWLMTKPKSKSDCGNGLHELLKVVSRINEQFHLLLQFLRRVEGNNQRRHEDLLKAIGSGEPPNVRTIVFVRKRREKITK